MVGRGGGWGGGGGEPAFASTESQKPKSVGLYTALASRCQAGPTREKCRGNSGP